MPDVFWMLIMRTSPRFQLTKAPTGSAASQVIPITNPPVTTGGFVFLVESRGTPRVDLFLSILTFLHRIAFNP